MSRTSTHFRLSTTAGRRRVLPVRAWLQAGAAAAAVGFALAGAATASADDGTAARDSSTSAARDSSSSARDSSRSAARDSSSAARDSSSAARDSSSAARDSSTQSRVSASSAPRASAAQAKARVALAGAPRGPVTGTGKALFNDSGKVIQTRQIYEAFVPSRGNPNVYLAINDPAFALWSKPQTQFRTDAATQQAFPEWLRLGALIQNKVVYPDRFYPRIPDVWAKDTLKGVRERLGTSEYGVFAPAFPTVYNPYLKTPDPGNNGDGVAVTRMFGTILGQGSTYKVQPFGTGGFQAYLGLLSTLATITPQNPAGTGCATNRCNSIKLAGGNDVVTPGWIGNAVIDTGAGDDIILASPQVNVAVWFNQTGYFRGETPAARVYYPTPYALEGKGSNNLGNSFIGGPGKDVIYYDGSVAEAYGDDGDDILAPSFGSFNWAFDTLIQGAYSNNRLNRLKKSPFPIKDFGPPLPLYIAGGAANGSELPYVQGTAMVSGPNALLGPDTDLDRGLKQNANINAGCKKDCPDSYYFDAQKISPFNIGLNGDPANTTPEIDDEINRLGGQKLHGGAGDDIIYGIDPDFYKGFKTAANGQGIRVAFNNPKDGKVNGRQHAQAFDQVSMFGGTGGDYFALGNPGNLDEAAKLDGTSLYRISGNSDSFKDKQTSDFGVLEGDVFEVNLTYQGANWTSSVVAPDGAGAGPAKWVKGGADALKVMNDLVKIPVLGIAGKALTGIPTFAAVASLISFVSGLVPDAKPEEPIKPGDPFYADPIGNWRTTINIQDWDPADSITIHVDPSNEKSDKLRRWDNVELSLNYRKTTSGEALVMFAQRSGEASPRPLIVLEEFTAKKNVDGEWWAWDFRQAGGQGAYVPITKDHLSFFGQVDPTKASIVKAIPGLNRYNFPVAEEALFRWTDPRIENAGLIDELRRNSERIVIQLDTQSLGYHWDIQYVPDASAVDKKASKLWVAVEDKWIGYSLEDLAANPELAELAKKATPVWAGPRVNPNLPAT